MCTYSMVMDWGRQQGMDYWTQDTKRDFDRALEQAREIDIYTKQPDCEDPKKAEFLTDVERRLDLKAAQDLLEELRIIDEQGGQSAARGRLVMRLGELAIRLLPRTISLAHLEAK